MMRGRIPLVLPSFNLDVFYFLGRRIIFDVSFGDKRKPIMRICNRIRVR